MFRLPIFLCLLLLVAGTVCAQQPEIVIGAHIEWSGYGTPSVKVEEISRTITIKLSVNRDCVTVYSPPTNKDYTYIIETPNGKVSARRPHSNGFQATFCYNLLGDDKVVRAHVILGSASFQSISGETGVLKTGQMIDIILPNTGRVVMQQSQTGKKTVPGSPVQQQYVEEDYGRFPAVHPVYPGHSDQVVPAQPVPVKPQPVQPAPVQPVQPVPVKPQPVQPAPIQPGQLVVPGQQVDLPEAPPATDMSTLQPIKVQGDVSASDKELAKYYGTAQQDKSGKIEEPVVKPFVLDHSTDDKIRFDLWAGWKGIINHNGFMRFNQSNGARGDALKFDEHLEMDDNDNALVGGFNFYYENFRISFGATDIEFQSSSLVKGGYQIGDLVFPDGENIASQIDYYWYQGSIGYTFFQSRNYGIGFDVFVDYYDMRYRVEGATGRGAAKLKGFFPELGIHAVWIPSDRWVMSLGVYGGYIDIRDHEIWKAGVNATIKFYMCPHSYIFVRGEWEKGDYEFSESEFHADAELPSTWTATFGIGLRL